MAPSIGEWNPCTISLQGSNGGRRTVDVGVERVVSVSVLALKSAEGPAGIKVSSVRSDPARPNDPRTDHRRVGGCEIHPDLRRSRHRILCRLRLPPIKVVWRYLRGMRPPRRAPSHMGAAFGNRSAYGWLIVSAAEPSAIVYEKMYGNMYGRK